LTANSFSLSVSRPARVPRGCEDVDFGASKCAHLLDDILLTEIDLHQLFTNGQPF
jgi:hypothetical protein